MDIKIEDFEGDINQDNMPEIPRKVINYLDGLEDGKLITMNKLATELGVSKGSIQGNNRFYKEKYSVLRKLRGTRVRLFGNQETIKYVKKQGW